MADQGIPCEDDVMQPKRILSYENRLIFIFRYTKTAIEQLEIWKC